MRTASQAIESPIGPILIEGTDRGIARIAFLGPSGQASLGRAAGHGASSRIVADAAGQIREYFAGARRAFDIPIDLGDRIGDFRRAVLDELRTVPYGERVTYSDLAAMAGRPRASRAVGTALKLNPVPLVAPCHRVVRSDGSAGEFAGGASTKRFLLDLESAGSVP